MTDIVEKLRSTQDNWNIPTAVVLDLQTAADAIERLRAALEKCVAVLNNSRMIETTDNGRVPLTNTMDALLAARKALKGEET